MHPLSVAIMIIGLTFSWGGALGCLMVAIAKKKQPEKAPEEDDAS